jgi:hypothetical protein
LLEDDKISSRADAVLHGELRGFGEIARGQVPAAITTPGEDVDLGEGVLACDDAGDFTLSGKYIISLAGDGFEDAAFGVVSLEVEDVSVFEEARRLNLMSHQASPGGGLGGGGFGSCEITGGGGEIGCAFRRGRRRRQGRFWWVALRRSFLPRRKRIGRREFADRERRRRGLIFGAGLCGLIGSVESLSVGIGGEDFSDDQAG